LSVSLMFVTVTKAFFCVYLCEWSDSGAIHRPTTSHDASCHLLLCRLMAEGTNLHNYAGRFHVDYKLNKNRPKIFIMFRKY